MNNPTQTYYYYDTYTRTVFHSDRLVDDRPDLMFLGSSMNPDKRMTVSTMVKDLDQTHGYKIKPLP